jgi:hypothetical protein
LQHQIAGEFTDIRTMADVQKLAVEDWPRYVKWDAAQKQLAAVAQEATAAQQRQQAEYTQNLAKYQAEQDRIFAEQTPEMADPVKAAALRDKAVKLLTELGFTEQQMNEGWNSGALRDARVQIMLRDAIKYREAQAKAKTPAPKPVPQVQRPGVSRPRGAADSDAVEALSKTLDNKRDAKTAAALLVAMRNARQ